MTRPIDSAFSCKSSRAECDVYNSLNKGAACVGDSYGLGALKKKKNTLVGTEGKIWKSILQKIDSGQKWAGGKRPFSLRCEMVRVFGY